MTVLLRPTNHAPFRPRSNPELIRSLVRRLTERDRWVMRQVWRHRVLTTQQLTALGWNSYNTAKPRLGTLYQLRALDRLRPWTAGGSRWHYVLDEPGAEILAAEDDMTVREWGYRRDRALAAVTTSQLPHTLQIAQVFVDLYAHTRTHPDTHVTWWTHAECAYAWGDIVKPDAAGRWTTPDTTVDFFLEVDRDTETTARVVAKLDAYATLASSAGVHGVVLLFVPTQRREARLRRAIGAHPPVPVALATHDAHPAHAVWVRTDDPYLTPRHLAALSQPAHEQLTLA